VCTGAQTCVDSVCREATISDPAACAGVGCGDEALAPPSGPPSPDAGVDATVPEDAGDAGGLDATLDAPTDASGDAPAVDAAKEAGPLSATAVGIGIAFGCALLPSGTVECWGNPEYGQLGTGDAGGAVVPAPIPVPGLSDVRRLVVGQSHACVLLGDGGVSCWGYNGDSATGIGQGDTTNVLVPTHVAGLPAAGLLTAGADHTCATSLDGRTIYCWGYYERVYSGSTGATAIPAIDAGAIEIAGGWGVTCGRFDDGTVRCWGENMYGVLGQGPGANDFDAATDTPLVVPGLPAVQQLCAGGFHVCALDTAHGLECWGDNGANPLGPNADAGFSATPIGVPVTHVQKVACGQDTVCVLYDDAGVQCWGLNDDGELGNGPPPPNQTPDPTSIPALGPASDLFGGAQSTCAALAAGGVACWGNDQYGQLGAGAGLSAMPVGAQPLKL
jgi:alpha-tubulin suppressor-like RCC1 family protein